MAYNWGYLASFKISKRFLIRSFFQLQISNLLKNFVVYRLVGAYNRRQTPSKTPFQNGKIFEKGLIKELVWLLVKCSRNKQLDK